MKEIGACEMIRVFIDDFVDKKWINIAKGGRIIKIKPELIEELQDLLKKAKEELFK